MSSTLVFHLSHQLHPSLRSLGNNQMTNVEDLLGRSMDTQRLRDIAELTFVTEGSVFGSAMLTTCWPLSG